MSNSSLRLARRSQSILYGVAFFALGLLFFLFAALDFAQHGEQARTIASNVWIGVAFLSVSGAFALLDRYRAYVQMAILESGLPAEAVITAIHGISFFRNSEEFREVEYRYESAPGRMHKGKTVFLTTEETRGWIVGERGTIKLDAANPARSVWIGTKSSRILLSDLKPNTTTGKAAGGLIDTGNSSFLTDFDKAGPGTIDTDEVDPVAEAEVYIAYGRDAQAEEILKEAMVRDKSRHEITLKLLEIYHSRKSASAYENLAKEFKQNVGETHPMWAKAAAMGALIDPGNSLYAGFGQDFA